MNNTENTSTATTTSTKGTKMKKAKAPITIRQKAIAQGDLKPKSIRESAKRYNTRLAATTMRLMTAQELAELKIADEYQREEKSPHVTRLTKVLLAEGEFLPPIIVARRTNEDNSVDRYIVDGQQRRRALVEANLPHIVIEVPFETILDEKAHFLGIQKGMTVLD